MGFVETAMAGASNVETSCLDCHVLLDADRRRRRLCPRCEADRAWRAFLSEVPHQLERLTFAFGAEYSAWTLEDFDPVDAQHGFVCVERNVLYGILIVGDIGPGKTAFAAALSRFWIFSGAGIRFTSLRKFFRQVRDTYRRRSAQSESDVIDPLTDADLLVLDDLGREGEASQHVLSVLHDVVDDRIRFHRPTIITTNLSGKEIEARYKGAIASRLSLYDRIVLRGGDRRREKR